MSDQFDWAVRVLLRRLGRRPAKMEELLTAQLAAYQVKIEAALIRCEFNSSFNKRPAYLLLDQDERPGRLH